MVQACSSEGEVSKPLPLPEFIEEAKRLVSAIARNGLKMRLLGALAFNWHCPRFGYIQARLGRRFTDIDFAAYSEDCENIKRFLTEMGYKEDPMVSALFGTGRLLFHDEVNGRHADVFFNKMEFCHDLPFRGRLEADFPTLPLAELVIEKMQILEINEKDIIDTIMLFREHEVGFSDDETINAKIIARLCANDWGLWRTLTMNLEKVKALMEPYEGLTPEDKAWVRQRIDFLLEVISKEPKSLKWKLRSKVGDKVKWYRDVEELHR